MVGVKDQEYRADIDGLRAAAVVAVVLFHAFPEYVAGGFAGVDVFFVISGFLISKLIFDEAESGSISLLRFYARRIRRLFPALAVVLTAATAIGWLILLPDAYARLGAQVATSSVFAANIYFWLQSSYFSPDAHTFPLLHLWSLGVEEQFYIAWPLLVMVLCNRRRWLWAVVLVGAASFVMSCLFADRPALDFYSPFTRAWELMAGALLAWLPRQMVRGRLADAAVALGLGLLITAFFFLDPKTSYPSWRAALPVAAAMLIILAGNSSSLARMSLANRPAIFVGLISYPLYLWHWPLLVFAAAVKLLPLTLLERGLIVALSFALASATFLLLEKPIRLRRPSGRRIAALAGVMMAITATGLIVIRGAGFEDRFPVGVRVASKVSPPASMRVGICLLDLNIQSELSDACIERSRPIVVVWGIRPRHPWCRVCETCNHASDSGLFKPRRIAACRLWGGLSLLFARLTTNALPLLSRSFGRTLSSYTASDPWTMDSPMVGPAPRNSLRRTRQGVSFWARYRRGSADYLGKC